ncbi:MAG TPA: hypothetical protein VGE16_17850 [Albitalea sp.]
MSTRLLLGLSTFPLLLAGLALSAYAQTQAPSAEQPMAAKDRTIIEGAYTRADANADGKLTKQEAARLPAIGAKFDDLDKDKDGMLDLVEFSSAFAETAK